MQRKQIAAFTLIWGLVALLVSTLTEITWLRALVGLPYVFSIWGYGISLIAWSKPASFLERFLLSSGFSVLLLYPLSVLVTLFEGKSGEIIFSSHLILDWKLLISLQFVSIVIAAHKGFLDKKDKFEKIPSFFLLLIPAAVFLLLYQLGRADLTVDDVDIGYRAYDLVDGMVAGRNAYVLSYYAHTPLALASNHFGMQFIFDGGFHFLPDWVVRASNAYIALLSFIASIALVKKWPKFMGAAFLLLFLSSNMFIFSGRALLREVFLLFFLLLAILQLNEIREKFTWNRLTLMGLFSSAILLSKSTTFFTIPIFGFLVFIFSPKTKRWRATIKFFLINFVFFIPILIYNLGAYLKTGYLDILFSRIFGVYHPAGYTGSRAHEGNFFSNLDIIPKLIADQLSVLSFAFIILGILVALATLLRKKKTEWRFFDLTMGFILLGSIFVYMLVGLRAYYLIYLTPMFAYFIMRGISIFRWTWLKVALLILITANQFILSANTHYQKNFTVDDKWGDSGRSGAIVPTFEPFRAISLTIRPWEESRGWKSLEKFKEENFTSDTVVALDNNAVDEMILRKYLNVQQTVKEFYLGDDLKEDFISFWWTYESTEPFDYLISLDETKEGFEIRNDAGKIFFEIYQP